MYNPLYQSTLDDINRRFGGLNNSALNDSMYQLNQQKNQALTGIANDVTGNLQNLANNYLQQQYNYFLNALMGNQNYGLQMLIMLLIKAMLAVIWGISLIINNLVLLQICIMLDYKLIQL